MEKLVVGEIEILSICVLIFSDAPGRQVLQPKAVLLVGASSMY